LRIRLSRAFTHHQLSSLITDELAQAVDQCDARLAIVSDITVLYCDPDVKEKREAFDLFSRNIRSLAMLAEQRNMVIVITNLQSRNKAMDNVLAQTAHISATLHDKGAFTQLTVTRHPFIQQGNTEVITLDNQTLQDISKADSQENRSCDVKPLNNTPFFPGHFLSGTDNGRVQLIKAQSVLG